MTISQLRRRIGALKRKSAPQLTIIKLRRLAEDISHEWVTSDPPEPPDVIQRIAKAGFRLPSSSVSTATLRTSNGEVKSPSSTPWCSVCCLGPETTATSGCSTMTSHLNPVVSSPGSCRFRLTTERPWVIANRHCVVTGSVG